MHVHSLFDLVGLLQAEHAEGEGEKPHVVATTVTTITAQSMEDKSTKERTQQVCSRVREGGESAWDGGRAGGGQARERGWSCEGCVL